MSPGANPGEPASAQLVPSRLRTHRLWEIDAARGIAILMMIAYHVLYDLAMFGISGIAFRPPLRPITAAFQAVTAGLFIGLVGVSLSVSSSRYAREHAHPVPYRRLLKRGLRILAWGMLLTLLTRLAVGPIYIRFGVLHCIGVSIILAYPFLGRRRLTLVAALVAIGLGVWLRRQEVSFSWLLWLGLKPAGEDYVDFIPLLPWFGVALAGVFAGDTLYPDGRRFLQLPEWGARWPLRWLVTIGRYSLPVYLIHQPVLIGLLLLVKPEILTLLIH